jgi:hypothetical protein
MMMLMFQMTKPYDSSLKSEVCLSVREKKITARTASNWWCTIDLRQNFMKGGFFFFWWLPDPARALEGVFFYQVSHCMAVGRPRTPAPTIAVTLWKAAYHHLAFLFPVTGSQSSKAFCSAAAESGAYPLSTFSTSCSSSSSSKNDNDIKFRNPQRIKILRNKIDRLDPKSQSKIHLTTSPRGPPARMQEEEDSATLEECGNPTIKPTNTALR